MVNSQKSSSMEQIHAEEKIFVLVEKELNIQLEKNLNFIYQTMNTLIFSPISILQNTALSEKFLHISASLKRHKTIK